MSSETAALIAAAIAAVASLVSLYVNSKLTLARERRQQLWQYDLEQIRGIEQLAGRIAEVLGGYPSVEKLELLFPELIGEYESNMGRLRRYRNLNQAMRDSHNAACRVVDSRRHDEEARPDQQDLTEAFRQLTDACDAVLERKGA